MRSERETDALETILAHASEAEAFLGVMDRQLFSEDRRTFHAVTRCIEIISEASRRLSDDLKARHPGIPWRAIAGVGNVYRHNYDAIAADAVFKTVKMDLPNLRAVIEAELKAD
jgi:uncharacterized protein with HEPN domain